MHQNSEVISEEPPAESTKDADVAVVPIGIDTKHSISRIRKFLIPQMAVFICWSKEDVLGRNVLILMILQ